MEIPAPSTRSVQARIAYSRRDVDPSATSSKATELGQALEPHVVTFFDARTIADQLLLERDGFVLRVHPSKMTDFFDLDQVNDVYLPEVLSLVSELSGAKEAVVLEHVIRGPAGLSSEQPGYPRHILGFGDKVHVDGDESTYRTWAAHVAEPHLADRCMSDDFAVYNIWRPITPVEQKPLAFCHAQTVARDDFLPAYYDGRFPGMIDTEYYPALRYFHLAFNPDHRWYYFSDMRPDEVAVFKQWDTEPSRTLCVPHTAFNDPTSRPDAVPRKSIEVRVFALR